MSRKLIVSDGRSERELLLVGTMVVGRDPSCDISDASPLLSRRHAEFIAGAAAIIVRDLGSRNGILVNGVKAVEAPLHAGDVVQVGPLSLRYMEDAAPLVVASEGADDDATAVIQRTPGARPAAAVRPPAPVEDESDKTHVMAPPAFAKHAPPPPPPQPPPALEPVPSAPPRQAPPPPARTAPPTPIERAAQTPTAPAPRAAAPAPEPERKPHVARTAWTMFVLLQVAALAAIAFLATAVPLIMWQGKVLDATAASRASALVNWLAADAAAALQSGGSAANAADVVSREAGVVSALILSRDGRVLSPAARATETVATIPALNLAPGAVLHLQQSWNGSLLEIAKPVALESQPQAAIAWITFRPSAPPEAGSGAAVLALPIIIVLVAAYLVSMRIGRRTLKALTVLNEDIELAVGGKLDAVSDPLGAKPVKDLADAVNYLVARLRAAGVDASTPAAPATRRPPAAAPPPPARARAPVGPPVAQDRAPAAPDKGPIEARLVVSPQFRVTEASPGCADLLGARPDALIGAHLIDAVPDRQVADEVMRLLSALPAGGEQRGSVAPVDRPYTLGVTVSRAGRDQPITITFIAARAPEAT